MNIIEKAFINGEWLDAADGQKFQVKNPANNHVIANIPDMGVKDTQSAIDAASDAFNGWQNLTPKERANILLKWLELLEQNKEKIAKIVTSETGKPYEEAFGEVMYGNSFIEWAVTLMRSLNDELISNPRANTQVVHTRYPIGVVGLITPWNFPYAMLTRKMATAIGSGCTCVVKPAEDTPLSTLIAVQLAHEAGVPSGVINVVTCDRKNASAVGKLLCESTQVAGISFTGSTSVGKILYAQCAGTVKRISLELGGMSPFIVFPSADIDKAVEGGMGIKFINCGQACDTANRFLIHEDVYDEFVNKFTLAVKHKLVFGDGSVKGVNMGPLINDTQFKRVSGIVQDAIDKGATLVYEAKDVKGLGDKFYPATILSDITKEMRIYNEEIFGPICPFIKIKTEEEALKIANGTRYGLASYVYTRDLSQVFRMKKELQFGMVGINDTSLDDVEVSFGGIKESGLGREGGSHCFDDYTFVKATTIGNL